MSENEILEGEFTPVEEVVEEVTATEPAFEVEEVADEEVGGVWVDREPEDSDESIETLEDVEEDVVEVSEAPAPSNID